MSSPEVAAQSVWHNKDFRIAWAAGLVNDTGDWVLLVALPVFVFSETGSGTATALLFVCQVLVSALLGPLGGSIVDRLDLKRCLIGTNLLQAITLLPLLAVAENRLWPAYPVVIVQALLAKVNNPANVALLPRLVRSDQIIKANAAIGASQSIARLVGAPLGGLVVAIGGLAPVVWIDAASFVVIAFAVTFIRSDTRPLLAAASQDDDDVEHDRSRVGVRAGLREIRARPLLRGVLTLTGVAQLAQGGFVVLFVVFVIDRLGREGTEVGVIRGTMAIGAVVGAIAISRLAARVNPVRLMGFGYLGMGVVSLLFWNGPYVTDALWVYICLFALSGIPGSALTVGLMTTVQTASPPDALGRVAGVLLACDAIGVAVGSIAAGVLVDVAPLGALLDGQAAIYLVCGALGLRLARGHAARSERVPCHDVGAPTDVAA